MIDALTQLVQPWADVYANHAGLATAIIAAHVLAMFIGGGLAVGVDRAILRAAPGSADGVRVIISDLSATHALVIVALVVSVASGAALFASDVPTYAISRVFWVKLLVLGALLLNGLRMRRGERRVLDSLDGAPSPTAEMPVAFPPSPWREVRLTAATSLTLWITLVLLGVVLSNG